MRGQSIPGHGHQKNNPPLVPPPLQFLPRLSRCERHKSGTREALIQAPQEVSAATGVYLAGILTVILCGGKREAGTMTIYAARCPRLGALIGLLTSILLLVVRTGTPASAAANPTGRMSLQDEKLSAHITAMSIREVMEEVSTLTGAQVIWLGQEETVQVSVNFTDLPFADGLKRILGERNFMLFYTSVEEESQLSEIWISSPTNGKGAGASNTSTAAGKKATPQLMRTALYGQDVSARVNAIRRLKRFAQTDSRVRSILSQLTRSAIEPEVREAAAQVLSEIK